MRSVLIFFAVLASAADAQVNQDLVTVEVRSYNLVPGQREAFEHLVHETLPLLELHGIDVVAHGPSQHDATTYFLIRAFRSPADRLRREELFYGSEEWRNGPRDRVLSLIESFTTVVIELDRAIVAGLRHANNHEGTLGWSSPTTTSGPHTRSSRSGASRSTA
jgi:hypothetical protein